MEITEVTYSRGATINTGNFNSVRVDFSATARVPATVDPVEVADHLQRWVDNRVAAEVAEHALGPNPKSK